MGNLLTDNTNVVIQFYPWFKLYCLGMAQIE